MSKPIPCLIRTLAPVHLGADEVYEPLGFVIDEDHHHLVAFEPWSFLEKLPDPDRRAFMELCRKGSVASLLDLYRFFHKHRRHARGRTVAVCPGLEKHYQEVIKTTGRDWDLQKAINQFTIHRTAYLTHDQRPYIPGSAVKGVLRTAYLNALAKLKPTDTPRDQRGRFDPRALEQKLLHYQKISEDPFRLLKVSDFLPVGEAKTRILYAVNEKKKASQFAARGPYQILEVIEPGAEFLGTLHVEDFSPELRPLSPIKRFLVQDELRVAAQEFYSQEKKQEEDNLFELGISPSQPPPLPDCVPLRLGRHSGAECVTIKGHRKIKILQGNGQPPKTLDHATTLWLAADFHQPEKRREARLRPLGWVALGEVTPDEARELASREETWRRQVEEAPPIPTVAAPSPATAPAPVKPPKAPPVSEVWEGATLTWQAGKGEVTAVWQKKKATGRGRDLVPPPLHDRLCVKRKAVSARVTVEPEGLAYRLVKIEMLS